MSIRAGTKTIGGNNVRTRSRASPTLRRELKDNPSKIIQVGKRKEREEKKKGEALLTTATIARLPSNRHRRDYGHSVFRRESPRLL